MIISSSSGLRFKILLPVGLGLALIIITGFLTVFIMVQDHLEQMVNQKISDTGKLFDRLIAIETSNLERLAESLTNNISYKKAFLANDRNALFNESFSLQARLREKNQISHFYFHLPDGTCFLRVHNPGRHSDHIERHTMKQALLTNSSSSGYELGPLGTLTLRVVVPWKIDKKIAGYIELGKELDVFIPILKEIKNVDLVMAIEKKFLDRSLWEEGLKIMGKQSDWDNFQDYVITTHTLDENPEDLEQALKRHSISHDREPFDLVCDDCRYRIVAIPLIEFGGEEVGDLFVLYEINGAFSGQKIFYYFSLIAVIFLLFFYLLFSLYLGRIEENLEAKQDALREQLAKHQETEKKLEEHQEQLDEMIRNKSSELDKAMAEVNILSGFLPICASCKNIRNDKGEWEQIESYIRDHSEAEFSHSYCPDCAKKLYSGFQKK